MKRFTGIAVATTIAAVTTFSMVGSAQARNGVNAAIAGGLIAGAVGAAIGGYPGYGYWPQDNYYYSYEPSYGYGYGYGYGWNPEPYWNYNRRGKCLGSCGW